MVVRLLVSLSEVLLKIISKWPLTKTVSKAYKVFVYFSNYNFFLVGRTHLQITSLFASQKDRFYYNNSIKNELEPKAFTYTVSIKC